MVGLGLIRGFLNPLTRDYCGKFKFSGIKLLNMGSKPDKELEKRDDISLLSEIIANSIYWQEKLTLAIRQIRDKFRAYH